MNPVLIPLADYQRHMLTAELAGLAAVGALTEPLIEGARLRYGATVGETEEIRRQLTT